jgi:RHS repeat-associated protein
MRKERMVRSAAAVIVLLFSGSAFAQMTGERAAETISRLNQIRGDSIAGSAVDTGTGAFLHERPILSVQGLRSLDFSIQYNSLLTQQRGALGYGWTHAFEASIDGNPQGIVRVFWDSGRKNSFRFVQTGQPYEPVDEAVRYDTLRRNTNGSWTLTTLDGTIYEFYSNGRLNRIGNKIFQFLDTHDDDSGTRVESVREPAGSRMIFFHYERQGSGLLQSVTDAQDRIVFFGYDEGARLVSVRNPVKLGPVTGEFFVPKTIPDNNPAGVTHTINVSQTQRIGLLQIPLGNISHQRPSEVRVTLISPQGTQAVLRSPTPSGTTGQALVFDGMVVDAFDGENPQGAWRVVVTDTTPGNTGTLNGWRLVFTEPTDSTRFRYDASARLVEALGPSGERLFANQYDGDGRVVAQDDGVDTNMITTFAYQESGGTLRTTYGDRMGARWLYEHDQNYRLLSVTDPLDNATRYAYNVNGDRTRVTNPLGHSTTYQYDQRGNVIAVVDARQNVTTMTYDDRNNLTSLRDPLGNESRFQYDNRNNLTRATDALNHADRKIFGGNSQMTGNLLEDGAGINMTYQSGQRATTTHPVSGMARNTYDNIGRLTRAIDTGGVETNFEYDSSSRVIRETSSLGFETRTTYDRRGRVVRVLDRRGNPTFNEYDNNDNLARIVDAQGNETRFEYDGEDRLIKTVEPGGNISTITYDATGQLTADTDVFGNTTTYVYDAAGNQVEIRDTNGVAIARKTYNELGQLTAETDAFANTIRYTYDAVGKVTSMRDAKGNDTLWTYDALGRPSQVRDPLNRISREGQLQDDVLAKIEDPRGNAITFGYDPANRITSSQTARGRRTTYRYNDRDQVTRETTAGGTVYDYTYDNGGRLASMAASGGGTTLPTIRYAYDQSDNLVWVDRQVGGAAPMARLRRTFDAVNRVATFQDSDGNPIQYTYTASGKLSTLTYFGRRVTYLYDEGDRLVEVRDWAMRSTRFTYDERGQVVRIDLPNGTFRVVEYDVAGRAVHRRDMTPQGAVISEARYNYDASSFITSEHGSTTAPQALPPTASMIYDADNRLEQFNGVNVAFDNNGNMTRGPLRNGTAEFRYDPMNRLTSAGGVFYAYDEEDRLIRITSDDGTRGLVVDPGNGMSRILAKTGTGGTTLYVYGLGLMYEDTGGQIRVYHFDHNGNTVAFTGTAGTVTGTVTYSPFGQVLDRTGETDSLFLFGGQLGVLTDPNGLNHMRFRWYSPYARRFLSEDAHFGDISAAGSLNRYAYSGNNPVNGVDPNGEFGFIGALIGVAAQLVVRGIERAATGRPFVEKGEEWAFVGELAGAAVAGGLTGGAAAGSSIGRAVLVGAGKAALAGAAGNVVKQGVRIGGNLASGNGGDVRFSLGDFASDVALSGAFGAIPAGKGAKALQRKLAGKPRFVYKLKAAWDPDIGFVTKKVKVRAPLSASEKFAKYAPEATLDFVLNTVQGGVGIPTSSWLSSMIDPEPRPETRVAPDHRLTRSSARQSVYAGRKGVYGEHAHWKFYLNVLDSAARPAPSNPAPALASF